MQPVPSRETLDRQTRTLRVGATVPIGDLAKWLVENDFFNTSAVELPGEFSIRGGIVDIFAPDWDGPVRMEFFGDDIESIRRFEISSQRSLESLEAIDVTVVGPTAIDHAHLTDYLRPQSWILLLEPMELEQQGRQYLERVGPQTGDKEPLLPLGEGSGRMAERALRRKGDFTVAQGPHPRPLPEGEGTKSLPRRTPCRRERGRNHTRPMLSTPCRMSCARPSTSPR